MLLRKFTLENPQMWCLFDLRMQTIHKSALGIKKLNQLLATMVYGGNTMKKTIAMQLCAFAFGLSYAHSATLVSYDIPVSASGTVSQTSVTTFNALTGVS